MGHGILQGLAGVEGVIVSGDRIGRIFGLRAQKNRVALRGVIGLDNCTKFRVVGR